MIWVRGPLVVLPSLHRERPHGPGGALISCSRQWGGAGRGRGNGLALPPLKTPVSRGTQHVHQPSIGQNWSQNPIELRGSLENSLSSGGSGASGSLRVRVRTQENGHGGGKGRSPAEPSSQQLLRARNKILFKRNEGNPQRCSFASLFVRPQLLGVYGVLCFNPKLWRGLCSQAPENARQRVSTPFPPPRSESKRTQGGFQRKATRRLTAPNAKT